MSGKERFTSRRRRPFPTLATVAVVIYGTFALLLVTIPSGMVTWLSDMNGNPVQQTLLRGAQALQAASQRWGLAAPYRVARGVFLEVTGKAEE
jgi:hypothetical protein